MKEETFKRKNEIGVEIEYTIIGYYKILDKEYCIYTDFFPENNIYNLRLFVDLKTQDGYEAVSPEQAQLIIDKFHDEVMKENKEV